MLTELVLFEELAPAFGKFFYVLLLYCLSDPLLGLMLRQ